MWELSFAPHLPLLLEPEATNLAPSSANRWVRTEVQGDVDTGVGFAPGSRRVPKAGVLLGSLPRIALSQVASGSALFAA